MLNVREIMIVLSVHKSHAGLPHTTQQLYNPLDAGFNTRRLTIHAVSAQRGVGLVCDYIRLHFRVLRIALLLYHEQSLALVLGIQVVDATSVLLAMVC